MATAQARRDAQRSADGRPKGSTTKTPARTPGVATPWGAATVLEEISVPQRAGDKRFAVVVQLLETRSGEQLIRFAYTTSGAASMPRARRGPVTMRARDLERLRAALESAPVLSEALRL